MNQVVNECSWWSVGIILGHVYIFLNKNFFYTNLGGTMFYLPVNLKS